MRGFVSRWERHLDHRAGQGQGALQGRGSGVNGAAALRVNSVRSFVCGNGAETLQADRTEGPRKVACSEAAKPRLDCDLTGQRGPDVTKRAREHGGGEDPLTVEVCIGVEVGRVG